MSNVLTKIVDDKRIEIEQRKKALPLESFLDNLTPSKKSLYGALSQANAGFIFECKKASPSKGLIRPVFDLDEILSAYKPYASAISVLTDEKYFQGKFEYLDYVTARVEQPVLNKDFFINEYQVHLARKYNADAILLMLSVLNDEEYQTLAKLADSYQLDILTEVSNQEEAERAIALGAKIIGINNRNLRDLSTDLAMTEQLAPYLRTNAPDAVIVSESGIYTNDDVRRLAPLSDGFLVGSSLMAQKDITAAIKRMLFGDIKVCGITRQEDATSIAQIGASYMGLIFAEKSKRDISLQDALNIVNAVPFNYVGVFVNAPVEDIAEKSQALNLKAVQLHGEEDQAYISALKPQLPDGCEIWQAKGVVDELPELDEKQVDKFLLDCKVGNQSGGTGQAFDWTLLENIQEPSKLVLAGGIGPDNIVQATQMKASIIDVNSLVESAPGVKDSEKLKTLFERLRQY
ncbi:bifunctional indole-3-glycerol-phosphate synthase TrpC/phosphoribosylanthranilate isomerase TrpF [Alteromonadaceae bacterium M269]|nr:bifunctional indole-3-glycerol-phosphate synthase TrpC/phosphoribosylanthranilate isomerase TrpF [Alteromonadaceae bacterium M269]